jgi:hypothetical protein
VASSGELPSDDVYLILEDEQTRAQEQGEGGEA